jgi:hypothetical protein
MSSKNQITLAALGHVKRVPDPETGELLRPPAPGLYSDTAFVGQRKAAPEPAGLPTKAMQSLEKGTRVRLIVETTWTSRPRRRQRKRATRARKGAIGVITDILVLHFGPVFKIQWDSGPLTAWFKPEELEVCAPPVRRAQYSDSDDDYDSDMDVLQELKKIHEQQERSAGPRRRRAYEEACFRENGTRFLFSPKPIMSSSQQITSSVLPPNAQAAFPPPGDNLEKAQIGAAIAASVHTAVAPATAAFW